MNASSDRLATRPSPSAGSIAHWSHDLRARTSPLGVLHGLPSSPKTGLPFALLAGLSLALVTACSPGDPSDGVRLVDPEATPETRALFWNLDRLRMDRVLYGHEDDLAYGVTWRGEPGRSDIKEVAGSYPAVYGWDIGWIELDSTANLDKINFEEMRGHIRDGYERGGVITISWHLNNPVTGGSSWDNVAMILHWKSAAPGPLNGWRRVAFCSPTSSRSLSPTFPVGRGRPGTRSA